MIYSELIKKYREILDLVADRRITEAVGKLDNLAVKCRNVDFRNRLSNYTETYRNILKYSFELSDDPQKEKVYSRLVKSLLELADEIKEELIQQHNLLSYYSLVRNKGWEIDDITGRFAEWMERTVLEKEAGTFREKGIPDQKNISDRQKPVGIINELFNSIWLSDKLSDRQIQLIRKTAGKDYLLWYQKSFIVSALTLSCLRHFDVEKLNLLFDFYQDREHQVWQRALVGIMLCLYLNDDRFHLYPEIGQRIKAFHDDPRWNKIIEAIVIQFLRARETEKIAEKIREEIIPEIWKAQSKLGTKLNMDELLSDKTLEDKNPEWETFFEDSPDLYNKIEEFSNLQMEGSDVFLSAFAMLKRFDFFNEPGNWFLPFYRENPLFEDVFQNLKEGFDSTVFLTGLERTRFLCNSDKYSFCLNVKHMPVMQRSMLVEFFNMELEAMNEMAGEDEIVYADTRDRSVIIQYVQDLYRFFRLHPLKKEFDDVFELPLDFHNTEFFHYMVDDPTIVRNIAEFYFEKEHFQEALEVFLSLEDTDSSPELFEKTAYCYQKLAQYEDALEYYKRAEMVTQSRSWLLNKIAFCYRRLGDYASSIKYYKQSEKLEPENLFIQSSLGQVYMDMEDFETALKYFFKVEYLAPDNIKVHRPIAWCSFVLKRLDVASRYFEKIIEKEGNQYDYMNLGHVNWCLGNTQKAIDNYRHSLKKSNYDHNWFDNTMDEDSLFLKSQGIPDLDIPLMLDYLRMPRIE